MSAIAPALVEGHQSILVIAYADLESALGVGCGVPRAHRLHLALVPPEVFRLAGFLELLDLIPPQAVGDPDRRHGDARRRPSRLVQHSPGHLFRYLVGERDCRPK
jgi:hypothetical protein